MNSELAETIRVYWQTQRPTAWAALRDPEHFVTRLALQVEELAGIYTAQIQAGFPASEDPKEQAAQHNQAAALGLERAMADVVYQHPQESDES